MATTATKSGTRRQGDYGWPHEGNTQHVAELWARAREIQKDHEREHGPDAGTWVPLRTVQVDVSIQPREAIDLDKAREYAAHFEDLPPITVQKDSFVVIDGRHRLEAAQIAANEFILITELDVPDAELADEAIRANTTHGMPLTTAERKRAGREMLERHPDWSNDKIAKYCGVDRRTVYNWRQETDKGLDIEDEVEDEAVAALPAPATAAPVDLPTDAEDEDEVPPRSERAQASWLDKFEKVSMRTPGEIAAEFAVWELRRAKGRIADATFFLERLYKEIEARMQAAGVSDSEDDAEDDVEDSDAG